MRGLSNAIASGALIAALVLIGCGSSGSSKTNGIALGSPAMEASRIIPARYTCDGKNVSLPLTWSAVPPATKELVLMLFKVKLINPYPGQNTVKAELIDQWGVAGLKPTLNELPAGRLPRGTLLGRDGTGRRSYSVCPAKGQAQSYLFLIYALGSRLSLQHGFTDAVLLEQARRSALAHGELIASYKRA